MNGATSYLGGAVVRVVNGGTKLCVSFLIQRCCIHFILCSCTFTEYSCVWDPSVHIRWVFNVSLATTTSPPISFIGWILTLHVIACCRSWFQSINWGQAVRITTTGVVFSTCLPFSACENYDGLGLAKALLGLPGPAGWYNWYKSAKRKLHWGTSPSTRLFVRGRRWSFENVARSFNIRVLAGYITQRNKKGVTVLIPKNKGVVRPESFWPTTMMATIIKLFHRILARRICFRLTNNKGIQKERWNCI